jgi:hypothetical protein
LDAILAGTFERAVDRRAREQREAEEAARRPAAASIVTFGGYVKIYVERSAQASGKTTWKADKYLLGHANISQTDTYLNVGRMGLHESMKRFDDVRCKTVASQPPIDPGLAGNAQQPEASKDLLH